MKNIFPIFLALLFVHCVHAAPLSKTTAVHTRPDDSAPTISVLNAGAEPVPATGVAAPLSLGWNAVELSGPFEVYVANKDLSKSLDVRAGASFHLAPKADSPVLTTMENGDVAELSGTLHGKWCQIRLQKKITGYINTGSAVASAATTGSTATPKLAATSAPPSAVATHIAPPPFSPAPAAPVAYSAGGSGHPAQRVNLGDGGSAALPRLFEGKFISTRRLLTPRRPYDYQLNDKGGERYAFLDISKLLLTEQIDKYVDHIVTIYGTAEPVPSSKDIVIKVESLQLH